MNKNERSGMAALAGMLVLIAIAVMLHKGGLEIVEQIWLRPVAPALLLQQTSAAVEYAAEPAAQTPKVVASVPPRENVVPESGGKGEKVVH